MTGQNDTIFVHQNGPDRVECLNAFSELSDLFVRMFASIVWVWFGPVDRPHFYWVGARWFHAVLRIRRQKYGVKEVSRELGPQRWSHDCCAFTARRVSSHPNLRV